MCRLFVFAKADNDHPDPALDHTKFKRGDVIDILEDGVHGGNEAEKSSLFRIIEMPGVPASDLQSLIMGDPVQEGDIDHPRLRANRLALDALEVGAGKGQKITLSVMQKENPSGVDVAATKASLLAFRSTVARQPKTLTLKSG